MTRADYDVIGIGNAIVDVLSHADDAFLTANGIEKGAMTLIDAARAEELYARMEAGLEISGGSVANSMVGIASFGGRAAYIGKVRADPLGEAFARDIRAAGVRFTTQPTSTGAPTARCLILVTPDAQRSMNTYLGACVELGPEDIVEADIAGAQVTYLEGYLWDPLQAKNAFRKAASIAVQAGRKVALSLSDAFCVHRHRDEFLELVAGPVDILFANEQEILALCGTAHFDEAVSQLRNGNTLAVLTRGAEGALVVSAGGVHAVPAVPVATVVDTTGAGDLFAAGFLYGYTQGRALPDCAHLGAVAAAEIISHVGARPLVPLAELMAK